MAFTPKFVDLVRNTTNTQGTGNLVLGAAVTGFTSFAATVQPGESFYYSVVGIDNPSEREVGRGTMQPDGSISREAISGSLTDFTAGTKTVALIAPAEWFNSVQSAVAGGGADAANAPFAAASPAALAARTIVEVPAILCEPGREGVFLFDAADLSAEVAADTRQGLYVAPASDPTGASGAWVRRFDGPVNPTWFGLVEGDNPADGAANDAAILAMFAALRARAKDVTLYAQALGSVRFPDGTFWFNSTIELKDGTVIIEGQSVGAPGGFATKLRFNGVTGIRVNRYNTEGTGTRAPGKGADGSIIRGLLIEGVYADADSEAHGIHMRAKATVEDCAIGNFGGDGIHIYAGAGAGGVVEGNANKWEVNRVRFVNTRDGLFVKGADANAGVSRSVDATAVRRWGIHDESFLGNSHEGMPHADSCAITAHNLGTPAKPASLVSHNGSRYFVLAGQDAWCSTNAPSGTTANNQGWIYLEAGGPQTGIPAWSNGITVRAGGPYRTSDNNARTLFLNPYAEGGQPKAQFVRPTIVIGQPYAIGPDGQMFRGLIHYTIDGLNVMDWIVNGTFLSKGGVVGEGTSHKFGPTSGAPSVNIVDLYTNASYACLRFGSWSGGVYQQDGELTSVRDSGFTFWGKPAINLYAGGSAELVASIVTDGLKLASGKTLQADGTTIPITNTAASRLIGRGTGEAGPAQEITLGAGLTMTGTTLSAAGGGGGGWTETTLGADYVAPSSTSFADISDGSSTLSYTPPADSFFEVQAVLLLETTANTNLPRLGVRVDAQGAGAYGSVQIDQTGSATSARVTADGSFTTASVDVQIPAGGFAAANTPYMAYVTIRGRSGASPAPIRLQLACEIAAANSCKVRAGSQMRVKAS